jgi:hypothetical protein
MNFIDLLEVHKEYSWFQQDGATWLTARIGLAFLWEFFGDRFILLPSSPRLSLLYFSLRDHLIRRVYGSKPWSTEELKINIHCAIWSIDSDTLRRVVGNTVKRVDPYIQDRDGKFLQFFYCTVLWLFEMNVLHVAYYGFVLLFLFITASRPAVGPTQPPMRWVPRALFLGIKRPGREADHSPSSDSEVKMCGAIPPLPIMSSWRRALLSKHRDKFTFTFYIM